MLVRNHSDLPLSKKCCELLTTIPIPFPSCQTFLFSPCPLASGGWTSSTASSMTKFMKMSNPRSTPFTLRPPWMFTETRFSTNRFSSGWLIFDIFFGCSLSNDAVQSEETVFCETLLRRHKTPQLESKQFEFLVAVVSWYSMTGFRQLGGRMDRKPAAI